MTDFNHINQYIAVYEFILYFFVFIFIIIIIIYLYLFKYYINGLQNTDISNINQHIVVLRINSSIELID